MPDPTIVLVDERTKAPERLTPFGTGWAESRPCRLAGDRTRIAIVPKAGGAYPPLVAAKVRALVATNPRHPRLGDPERVLVLPHDPAAVAGFVVPFFAGKELNDELPDLRDPDRLPLARLLVEPFAAARSLGRVMGDNNERNFIVGRDGRTDRLTGVDRIDLQGTQVVHDGRHYPCQAALPRLLPPELQGKDLAAERLTPACDAFGLGMLLFEVLTGGKPIAYHHPDRTVKDPERIKAGLYFGLTRLPDGAVVDPDAMARYVALPDVVKALLRGALLGAPHDRPPPDYWAAVLDKLLPKPAVRRPRAWPSLGSVAAALPKWEAAAGGWAKANWNTVAAAGLVGGAAWLAAGPHGGTAPARPAV
ncbi:MAG: hypothetical protein K2X87_14845, partial [Gemmataceae bacterium]|nr:hypothetical protein [Gemmataceae bacterium]